MVFYIHMSGDGIGTLNVYMFTNSSRSLLLSLTGNQGNYWNRQEVPLSSSESFRIMFEGKVGLNTRVHICLDDIIFSSGCILSSRIQTDTTPRLLPGRLVLMMPYSIQCYQCKANCVTMLHKCIINLWARQLTLNILFIIFIFQHTCFPIPCSGHSV